MPRIIIAVICCTLLLLVSSPAQTPEHADKPQASTSAAPDDLAAMKQDLARMRALLAQMQTNLGYVSTTTQPLRHQFELENEMWLTLINQMDRRVQKMERESKK